ncbi:MAG: hypothetical protein EU529_05840 [Promethearchaeota archaeon]|nr:MAG: hypothetical protein EU529_05840 [Candidatus Lokiarchaeota archaeon]
MNWRDTLMTTIYVYEKEKNKMVGEYEKAYYKYFKNYIMIFSMKTGEKLMSYPDKEYRIRTNRMSDKEELPNISLHQLAKKVVYLKGKCANCGRIKNLYLLNNVYDNNTKINYYCDICRYKGIITMKVIKIE